jgi:DnaJ-class molecular chaperone
LSNINGDLDTMGVFGIDDDQQTAICDTCDGTGYAFRLRFSPFRTVCHWCGGSGEVTV